MARLFAPNIALLAPLEETMRPGKLVATAHRPKIVQKSEAAEIERFTASYGARRANTGSINAKGSM